MSSSSETQKSIRKMPPKRKRAFNFCSTPVMENIRRLSSISISAVDTNSSSSTKRRTLNVNAERKRIKKKQLQKNSLEHRKGKQERKTSKKRGEGKRRKIKLIEQRICDDDWETCDESLRQSRKFETNVLFNDIRSPEHIRDVPRFVPNYLDSPILRVRGWEVKSPQISSEENGEKLLVKDLPFSRVQLDDSDDEGDLLVLKKDNAVKTYPGLRNKKLQKDNASNEKYKPWLVNVSVPTTPSDHLWDSFVRNNYENVAKYLAQPGNDTPKYHCCRGKNIRTDENESFEKEDNHGEQPLKWEDKIPLADNMEVWRGCWNKPLRKWIRTYDIYNFQEHTNAKLKKKGIHNMHVTLNQFLQKKKANRRNTAELDASSSSAIHFSNIRENSVEKKKRKKKRLTVMKNKCKINSAKLLTSVRFKKNKQNWRIVKNVI